MVCANLTEAHLRKNVQFCADTQLGCKLLFISAAVEQLQNFHEMLKLPLQNIKNC